MNSYISLDLETTGLNPKYDRIIEIGAAKIENGEVTDTFSTFVNPGRRLDARIIELTGINDADVQDAPEIKDVLRAFLEFSREYPLLGHNIIFDYSFLKHAMVNAGLSYEREAVDTLKISRNCHRELPSKKLTDMCAFYGIEFSAHRALNDALATAKLYEKLKENFAKTNPEEFAPKNLLYAVKKESPIRPSQKERIEDLIKRHNIDCPYDIEKMTRNEATRYYDMLFAQYGK